MTVDLRKALGLDSEAEHREENTVSYEIYPASTGDLAADHGRPAPLEAAAAQLLHHLWPYLKAYIWQRDRFDLHSSTAQTPPWRQQQHRRRRPAVSGAAAGSAAVPVQQPAGGALPPPCLWGSLCFGDNIEDEWFVTWLLLEVTRAFPGLAARVWDNDGEFLLIEAAYALPRWLKPETAQHRVWLLGGAVHLVPLPARAGDPLVPAAPTLRQALTAVRSGGVDTVAPPRLQAALQPRLGAYPGRARELMHRATVALPEPVARLLVAEPQLVAAAVEAFHYRDLDDMKAASRMAAFTPQQQQLEPASVVFSRCLYAQLALQEYAPPRGYPLPLPSDPGYPAAELGMKLTAGFEMLLANRARFAQPAEAAAGGHRSAEQEQPILSGVPTSGGALPEADSSGAIELADLRGDAGWAAVVARLQAGSDWAAAAAASSERSELLLQQAAQSYRQSRAYAAGNRALAAPAVAIESLLAQAAAGAGPAPPPPAALPPPDSDAWLHEGSAQLDQELQQRQAELEQDVLRRQQRQRKGDGSSCSAPDARPPGSGGGGGAPAAGAPGSKAGAEGGDGPQCGQFDPSAVSASLRAFVEAASGLEGVEAPGRCGHGGGVSLRPRQFATELEKALGLEMGALGLDGADDDDADVASESSEEGSSFYSGASSSEAEEEEGEEGGLLAEERPAAVASKTGGRGQEGEWQHPQQRWQQQQQQQEQQHPLGGQQQQQQERWEVGTATDSDDERGGQEDEDADEAFMEAYSRALDQQLAATRMAESFERAQAPGGDLRGQQEPRAPAAAAGGGGGQQGTQQEEETMAAADAAASGAEAADGQAGAVLRPVDVDLNLVTSLLASYSSQQGLPGPASNLAGMLGIRLPDAEV